MTYTDQIQLFYAFAIQHPLLKTRSWGNLSDYSREDYITEYPAIHCVPQPSSIDNTYTTFNWTIMIYDLLNEFVGVEGQTNQLDSLSLCHEILNDFYAFFTNQLTGCGFYLQQPVQFSPFIDRFKEAVVGVEANITIIAEQTACLPDNPNLCYTSV